MDGKIDTKRFSFFAHFLTGGREEFKRAAQSFGQLRDPAFLNRRPREVKIIEANGRQTLQEIFSSTGMNKDLWPSMAILNGMELGAKPPQGRLVNVVR